MSAMRKHHWALSLALAGCLAVFIGFVAGGIPRLEEETDYVPGQVLLKFRSWVPVWRRVATLSNVRSRAVSRITRLDVFVVQIPDEAKVEDMVTAFNRNPDIEYAEPNHIFRAAVTPNDIYFKYQYALFNKGQDIDWVPGGPQGKPSADIKAPSAWEETTGKEDVIIGILDTGVDLTHEDLKNKILPGYDFVNDDPDPTDDHYHGTMVAGVVGAETNNGKGIAGIAWKGKILPVKVLNDYGEGRASDIAAGILWAVEHGAKILNLSFAAPSENITLGTALKDAFEKQDVFIAAAAGNDNTAVYYPAAYEKYVCAVAATDYNDERAVYSNFGYEIDCAAPGEKILTTIPSYLTTPLAPFPYGYGWGTSMASAHVAGLAALIKSIKPSLKPGQIMNIIRYSADDVNASVYKGKDEFLGYGRINMEKALVPLKISN
jgi:subtilisin family serine protease